MRKLLPLLITLFSTNLYCQTIFTKVEPAFWWVGFNNSEVEVLFHHKELNLSTYQPKVQSESVTLKRVTRTENPRYVFLSLEILPTAKPGIVPILFTDGKKSISYSYELKARSKDKNRIQGFNSSDVMYLIMPDRFANGDVKNDSLPGFYQGVHRDQPFSRHGGDLKGISDHLDYIKDLGVTAIWLNPILENNQKRGSYHGYAITDLYKVDQRFGSNEEYLALINKGHSMGIKMIQDMVINHIGIGHWLMKDLPEKDWVHQFPEFTRSNYRSEAVSDPYGAASDLKLMSDGWFDNTMPDVNQTNRLFATYLIQNSIWWIEYAGIDGIRMDTYPYPDKMFMANWAQQILKEYPAFNIVGEVLVNSKPMVGYWQQGAINKDGYQSNLPSVIDYPLTNAINTGLNENGSWDGGLSRLYTSLSQDFIYPNPNNNVTFVDSHDMSRYYHNVGRDLNKFKMGLVFLLTVRGIPQLYYGTELLMDGDYSIHPTVRRDVPGGWREDKENNFIREGRSKDQNEAFDFMKKLLDWRKTKPVIHGGKLMHFIPTDNVYVYFRYDDKNTVMVILNGNKEAKTISTQRFNEVIKGKTKATNMLTGEVLTNINSIALPSWGSLILEVD